MQSSWSNRRNLPLEQGENQQKTQPTYRTGPESNQGHIGERRTLSPLRQPCSSCFAESSCVRHCNDVWSNRFVRIIIITYTRNINNWKVRTDNTVSLFPLQLTLSECRRLVISEFPIECCPDFPKSDNKSMTGFWTLFPHFIHWGPTFLKFCRTHALFVIISEKWKS